MRGARILAAVVLLCSLASPGLTAQGSSSVDPCKLLTAAEVGSVLGITSLPGRPYLGSKVVCYYAADTGYAIGEPSVTVMVMPAAAFENGKTLMSKMVHPITGVGDDAYTVGSGSYLKLGVRKGSRAFSVTVVRGMKSKGTPAELESMEKQLAQKAAARL